MTTHKILGVIEGFYGTPWYHENRLSCIDFLAEHGWNTYVWAAKLEPRHREKWNEPFTEEEITHFAELAARSPRVQVAVGLTPGDGATADQVIAKLSPAITAGCTIVVLCFDDLPVLHSARQHQNLAHAVRDILGCPVWIVPTHYAGVEGSEYLSAICDGLHPDIDVMWTGTTVVTDTITVGAATSRATATHNRAPLVWDNTPVNDARMRGHMHLGPYTGRDPQLLDVCSGVLLNPMEEFAASLPTLMSAVAWSHGDDPIVAWADFVDSHGLRRLAEATSYRGDAHWPGERPTREWWESVANMTVADSQLEPWVTAAQEGARLALAALNVIETRGTMTDRDRNIALFQLMGWGHHRARTARTFGAGPRVRPVATQDENGRFVLLPESVEESESLVDQIVSSAIRALRN